MKKKSPQTQFFIWNGFDNFGNQTHGEIEAINIRFAKGTIQRQNITITKIKRKRFWYNDFYKITTNDITLFLKHLSLLLSSNIPLLQSLEIILKNRKKTIFRKLITDIINMIREGYSLSFAINKHKKYFDHVTYQLILNGEQSGKLDIMLDLIITYREKTFWLKNKIKKALYYPCIVISIAFITINIFIIFVIPRFTELFTDFNQQLPFMTRFVISTTNFLQYKGWIVCFIIFLIIYITILIRRHNQTAALYIDQQLLKIPILGKLLKKILIVRFVSTLHVSFSAGIPLLEILQSLHTMTNNHVFNKKIQQIGEGINRGQSLHETLQMTYFFPGILIQMVAIGEEAGKLENMFQKIIDFYETEIEYLVDRLIQSLEPTVTILLGVIIGGLVIAMYLPLFKLGMLIQ